MPQNAAEHEQREFTYEEFLVEFCPDELEDDFDASGVDDGDAQSEQLGHRMAEATIHTLMQAFENR